MSEEKSAPVQRRFLRKRLGRRTAFKPGHPRHAGRPKGVPNRHTRVLREAILLAAEQVGNNGKGKDGIVGYLRRVAIAEPKSFSMLLARVLPLQIVGDPDRPLHVITNDMTPQQAAALYSETLGMLKRQLVTASPMKLIEHDPLDELEDGTKH